MFLTYKVAYINSSNFWWTVCSLFCLHSCFYLLKIFVTVSVYKMFIIIYFLDTLKCWDTFLKIFLMLETKPKMKCNKRNNVSFLCQLVCSLTALPWQFILVTLPSFSNNLMFICSLLKRHEENSLLKCLRGGWETIVINWSS